MPSGDLARLLAAVGVLLGSHAASDLVVMPRAELERREYAAYGQGWRDAAAQCHRPAEWADDLPATDVGDRTPGQAAVIPFRRRIPHGTFDDAPRDVTDLAGTAPAEALTGTARPTAGAANPSDSSAPETVGPEPTTPGSTRPAPSGAGSTDAAHVGPAAADGTRPDPPARLRSATPSRPPAFAPKSRRSKVPTIPRLPRPRRQARPDGQD